jgi:cation transporter-like permease
MNSSTPLTVVAQPVTSIPPTAPIERGCGHCGRGPKVLEYRQLGKRAMSLLIVYVALVITGDFIAYFIGVVIERTVPVASLPAFLAMYFVFLWVAWVIAVRVTQPRVRPS